MTLLLLLATTGCHGSGSDGAAAEAWVAAEPFVLPATAGGEVSLEEACRQNTVVVLSFWTTWCGPCIHELPLVEALHQRYHDQGMKLLAIEVGSDPDLVSRLVETTRVTFPVLLDTEGSVAKAYDVVGYPWTVVIDDKCEVVGSGLGPVNDRLSRRVARLLVTD